MNKLLHGRKMTIGSWLAIPNEASAEIMANAGFDWLVIDMEHSPIVAESASRLIRIIDLCGLPALCRLPSNDPVVAKQVLDAGAAGIIVPMVENREEAIKAVEAAYYPPKGIRGVGLARAQGYGSEFEAYKDNYRVVVIAMIESMKGVGNIEEIVTVSGLNGILVGPYDISASFGLIGQLDHPKIHDGLKKVIGACDQANIGCGLHVVHPSNEAVQIAYEAGYTFLALGIDMIFLDQAAKKSLEKRRNGMNGQIVKCPKCTADMFYGSRETWFCENGHTVQKNMKRNRKKNIFTIGDIIRADLHDNKWATGAIGEVSQENGEFRFNWKILIMKTGEKNYYNPISTINSNAACDFKGKVEIIGNTCEGMSLHEAAGII